MSEHCIHCDGESVVKYGYGRNHSRRLLCKDCNMTFTLRGKRGTYSSSFRKEVVESYCHQNKKVKEVIKEYGISTRTLIKWKKEHQKGCDCGEK